MKITHIIRYFVNVIMSHMLRRLCQLNSMISIINGYLIINNQKGIILLTDSSIYSQEAYHEAKPNKQAKRTVPAKPEGIKPPPGTYSGQTLSGERIFRPARPASGPLRDNTTSSDRQSHSHRNIKAVRCQSCNLLSNRRDVRLSRPHRPGPTQTGTEEPAQMHGRNHRVRQAATFTATRCNLGRPYSRNIQTIRHFHSSSYHRERTCQCKKKESNCEKRTSNSFFKGGTNVINQYEQLRASMLSPNKELHTSGYGVFMLRGMLGWIKALPNLAPTPEKECEYTGEISDILSETYTDVVNVLANMVVCCMGESS